MFPRFRKPWPASSLIIDGKVSIEGFASSVLARVFTMQAKEIARKRAMPYQCGTEISGIYADS